uniref:thymidylate synthase n=1 Tax=viral metagenome TaxID=1070528 RepID=A0A6C0JRW7_9ZZZZ
MGEEVYLDLIKSILINGEDKESRNGKTLSCFGTTSKYNISNFTVPLLTTKKINFDVILKELLWFISGSTNSRDLKSKIWDKWSDNGELGPIYGFQWRHAGEEYKTCYDKYEGIDQLQNIIDTIKTDPGSRRLVIDSWDVSQINRMKLPPCHYSSIFSVTNNKISCHLIQRSGDIGIGVPFNIVTYSILTHIIAKMLDLESKELVHTISNAHIYYPHIEPLKEQLNRKPFMFPRIKIPKYNDINDYKLEDFELIGYESHPRIKMEVFE